MTRNYCKLRTVLAECRWYRMCPMKRFYEAGKLDGKLVELYCKGDWGSCVRFEMEERGEPHPDWMMPDGSTDEGLR